MPVTLAVRASALRYSCTALSTVLRGRKFQGNTQPPKARFSEVPRECYIPYVPTFPLLLTRTHMLRTLRGIRFAALALAAVGTLSAAVAPTVPAVRVAPARFHTKLVKSAPAANDTLATAPTAISLWFNEAVDLKVTTVKVAGASGTVKTGALTRDAKLKDAPVVAAISSALAAGKYTVSWSVAGDDGHPVKGTFDFVVKGAK